jgi:hypothetical protein
MANISVVTPGCDSTARTMKGWGDGVVLKIRSSPHKLVQQLSDNAADRNNCNAILKSSDVLFFFGHGAIDALLNGNTQIIDIGNIVGAKAAVIVAWACNSASQLGPASVQSGVSTYIGFDSEFGWVTRAGNSSYARLTAAIIKSFDSILSATKLQSVYDELLAAFHDMVHYFNNDPAGSIEPDAVLAKIWINWNESRFRLLGNGSTQIY